MSEQTLSADGEWMWDGDEWIPAPPASRIPHQIENHQSVQDITQSSYFKPIQSSDKPSKSNYRVSSSKIKLQTSLVPWIGVILIAVSLLLPYLSVMGLFEMTGFEMMVELGNLFSELVGEDSSDGGSDNGSGSGSGSGSGLDADELVLLIAAIMYLLSPFFFALSAIISAIVLLMKKSPRTMGGIHLTFAIIFMISAFISPTTLGVSILDFIGIGFYMGAFSSVLLMIKK